MSNYTVYMHIAPNDKKYIGITRMIPKHRWNNGNGYKGKHFRNAIEKYGWDNFQHIIIAKGLTENEAKWLEVKLIKRWNTTNREYGYNVSPGGDIRAKETGEKISKALKGRKLSKETIEKRSETVRGRTLSEETKEKIGKAHKGKIISEEQKRLMSEKRRGKYTGKESPVSRSIICITTNMIFYSISEAAEYYNLKTKGNISSCCSGKRSYSGKLSTGEKLVWKYIDIIEI